MRPETQLLLRNEDRILGSNGSLLVVDPPDRDTVTALGGAHVTFWIRHYGIARRGIHETVIADASGPGPGALFSRAIIFLPKGRRLQRMTFAQVGRCVEPDGEIYVVGGNQTGIKSAVRDLQTLAGPAKAFDAARKCTLLVARSLHDGSPFDIGPWRTRWTATVGDRSVEVASWPGTFCDGSLDVGTAELLETIESVPLGSRVLDLASGSGVVGAMIAKYRPDSTVLLADAMAWAVASSADTLAFNDLPNGASRASDVYSDVDGPFDAIVCNPPFHEGVATDTSTAHAMISEAPRYLSSRGELWLVANSFLPYREVLQKAFAQVQVVRDGKRFRVYRGRAR